MNAFERFWSMVDIRDQRECWEWLGSRDQYGYGVPDAGICVAYGEPLAHRIACALMRARIARHDAVLHSCDNPSCCNPRHLRWGDDFENADDRRIAQWAIVANESRRHSDPIRQFNDDGMPWSVKKADPKEPTYFKRGLSRIDDDIVRSIRADHASGMTCRDIAAKHGLTISHVDSIAKRRIWRHVDQPLGEALKTP